MVVYQGRELSLAGVKGEGLFDPTDHGLKPVMISTACWRGFVCTYEVVEVRLRLRDLEIGLDDDQVELCGRRPQRERFGGQRFTELAHPVPFTGGLLLADGFIQELYVHMGFHPAWKFEVVHELIFADGELTSAADRSREIAQLRQEIAHRSLGPEGGDRQTIQAWVERTFQRDYRW